MTNYFEGIISIEELKKCYRKLAMQFHPDMGGSHEEMTELNTQYENSFKKLQNKDQNINDGFRKVIDKIINLNVKVEICGNWIWISGNTKSCRKELKSAGFWWASKKKMWYWHPEEDNKIRKSSMSMEKIREKYGSKKVKKEIKIIV